MSDIDKIKQKLAKLLRLGEDTAATDGEINNALYLATQLMAKHQLTRDDICMDEVDPLSRLAFGEGIVFSKSHRLSFWELRLVNFVMQFIGSVDCFKNEKIPVRRNGIAELNKKGEVRRACGVVFFGSVDDVRCAVELFEELRDAIATMAVVRWGGWARGAGFAYADGFAVGLKRAHEEAQRRLTGGDATTSALILKSNELSTAIKSKAREWLATERGVRLAAQTGKTRRRGDFTNSDGEVAYREGIRDGRNYETSRPETRAKLKG